MTHLETIIKRFEQPDEVREFEKGKLELVTIAGQTLGRATYDEPYVSLHLFGAGKYAK